MLFLNPTMLLGILGIGAPIIVHLIRTQAAARVPWAATRFLKAGVEQNRRRHRWEDALLLLLRCLVVTLLALALARPAIVPGNQSASGNPALANEPHAGNQRMRPDGQLRVLLVDGGAGAQGPHSATFFLGHALQPVPAGDRNQYFIQTKTVTPAQLPLTKLNDFDAIMLADVPEFSDDSASTLQQYASHGGALVIFPGPHVNRGFYNDQLYRRRGLLPAEWGEPQAAKVLRLAPAPYDHPIVSFWNDPAVGDLTSARFYHVLPLLSYTGERQDIPEVVLRFEDGSAAMIAIRYGDGYVVMFASTANTTWNDLPTRPVFVPLIHRTLAAVCSHNTVPHNDALNHRTNTPKDLTVLFAAAAFLVAIAETILARTFNRSTGLEIPRGRRYGLVILRFLALVCMLPLLLRPSFLTPPHLPVEPRLDLLIDTSASMTVRDSGKPRIDRVRLLLKDMLHGLENNYKVVPYVFGQHVREFSSDQGRDWIDHTEATSPATAIGDSVEELLDRGSDQPAAGIILFTDGRNTSGASLREAGTRAHERNVPLYIGGIGSESPSDVMIADVSAPELVFAQDEVPVTVRLRSSGMEGRSAALTLKAGDETVGQTVVSLSTNGEDTATIIFHPNTAGFFRLLASVESFPDEATDKNNRRSKLIYVTDRKVRVLLVSDLPQWSFQSWQSVLAGDPHVELHTLLFDEQSNTSSQFPADLSAYDLIICGDVNPRNLTQDQLDSMDRFVSESGGGFVMIAGPHNSPRAYQGMAVEKLLPVEPDSEETISPSASERIVFTDEASSGSLLRMPDSLLANASALAPLEWIAAGTTIKAAAKVLATVSNTPLMVVQQYGRGRTLYIASDELWRWTRDLGEQGYAAFLEQTVQSMSLPRLLPRRQPSTTDTTPTREFEDISMNAASLREMAQLSGGEFFHENEFDKLVRVIQTHPNAGPSSRKIVFWLAPLYFVLLMNLLTTEWTLRRLSQLK